MRKNILAAAELLVHQHGFSAITFGALARAIRRNKSTISHHYPHRDTLAEALIARLGLREQRLYAALLERARRRSRDPRAALLRYLDDIADMMVVSSLSPMAAFASDCDALGSGPRLALTQMSTKFLSLHRAAFADALRDVAPVPCSAQELAATLQALMDGSQCLGRAQGGKKAAHLALGGFRELVAAMLANGTVVKATRQRKNGRRGAPPRGTRKNLAKQK